VQCLQTVSLCTCIWKDRNTKTHTAIENKCHQVAQCYRTATCHAWMTSKTEPVTHKTRGAQIPHLVTCETECWVMAQKTFRFVNAVLFLTCKNGYQFTSTKQKTSDNRSTGNSRIVGPENEICFIIALLAPKFLEKWWSPGLDTLLPSIITLHSSTNFSYTPHYIS
jgi:hypothetical protein